MTGVEVSKAIRSEKPALRVTWTIPQSDVTISQYRVEYRSGMQWRAASPVSPGSTTSTLLEALDAGTVYEIRVRAVSARGTGPWSEVESQTTYTSELCSEFKPVESANTELILNYYWQDINPIAAKKLFQKCTLLNYQIDADR